MGMKREKVEVQERARAKGFMRMELIETIPEEHSKAKPTSRDSDMVVVESSVGRWWLQSFDGDEPLLGSESENCRHRVIMESR